MLQISECQNYVVANELGKRLYVSLHKYNKKTNKCMFIDMCSIHDSLLSKNRDFP